MTNMDDLKRKAEEGLKTLKDTAQDIAFTVEKQARIGKKRYIDLARIERNLQKSFEEIGEYVYEEATSGRAVKADDPYVQERVVVIKRMKTEIEGIEEEISEIRQTIPPKHKDDY
jgi:dsDNA-specific endonuclease/ATPase MutS2